MHHHQTHNVFLRINPSIRARRAAPAELAYRADPLFLGQAAQDRHPEAIAKPERRNRRMPRRQMILAHEFHRLAAQELSPIESAIVQQHQAEPRIVSRCGNQTSAPGEKRPRMTVIPILRLFRDKFAGHVLRINGAKSPPFLFRHVKRRVVHPQRPEDPFGKKLIQRLTGNHFHKSAKHIIRRTVNPALARLAAQWHATVAGNELRQRHTCLLGLMEVFVRQPTRVRQQIVDRDVAPRRHQLFTAIRLPFFYQHIRKVRQVLLDRIIQKERTLFVQHQNRDDRDRLGHRVNPKNRIVAHRLLVLDVHQPVIRCMRNPAVSCQKRDAAGNLPVINKLAHQPADSFQPFPA